MVFNAKELLHDLYPPQTLDRDKEALRWAALVLENDAEERRGFGGKTTRDYVTRLRATAKRLRRMAHQRRRYGISP